MGRGSQSAYNLERKFSRKNGALAWATMVLCCLPMERWMAPTAKAQPDLHMQDTKHQLVSIMPMEQAHCENDTLMFEFERQYWDNNKQRWFRNTTELQRFDFGQSSHTGRISNSLKIEEKFTEEKEIIQCLPVYWSLFSFDPVGYKSGRRPNVSIRRKSYEYIWKQ